VTAILSLAAIEKPARTAERRLRLARVVAWASKALAGGLTVAIILLAGFKLRVIGMRATVAGIVIATAIVLVVAVVAYVRRLPRYAGAAALDKFHGLSDRLSSALSFGELPEAERSPMMIVAMEDALAHLSAVDPKKAVRVPPPREWPFVAGMIAVVAGLVFVRGYQKPSHVPPTAKTIEAVDVAQDDLDAMREFLREVDQRLQTDEAKAATQEFNQLIEDLANKRLDRTEAFRRMQQLEDKLLAGREVDAKALEEALKKMGEELKKSEMSKPAGEALENKNLAEAERAMKDLAKKLREKGGDKAQLEKLRAALKSASEDQAKRAEAIAARREELKEQLLKQKQAMGDGGASEQDKSLLQKRERELERLDRDGEQQQKAQRELERLDRELEKAAEDLMKDMGLSAQDLENAAEDINRMSKQEMTQEEKEQLRQKLQELRETMRQQAQGGQGQMSRMRMFQTRARGQGGQSGQQQQGQQQQGQGQGGPQGQGGQQAGDGQQAGNGQGGQQAGAGEGQGQGQNQGQGLGQGSGGETWILGPNGEKLMMITARKAPGTGSGSGQNSGQWQGQNGGQNQGQKGPGWGTGHDPNVQGGATNLKGATQDTQVAGSDTGQGGSRSEVILGASERGFASRGYEKVFREYHTVAEEALDRDEIPGGYRFYVRRYFQLIRPRDEGDSSSAPAPSAPSTP